MSNEERKKILETVRRLSELANPEKNSFEHEVAAASAKMQKLMDEYQIQWAEVMLTDEEVHTQHFTEMMAHIMIGRLKKWHWGLGRTIARITGTKHFSHTGYGHTARDPKRSVHGDIMSFFGPKDSIALACELYDHWVVLIDDMAKIATSAYVKELTITYADEMEFMSVKQVRHLNLGSEHPNVWRDSWLLGVIAGINESLNVQEKERSKETSTALAVISKELAVAYKEMTNRSNFKTVTPGRSSDNLGAYDAGHEVGKTLNLSKPIKRIGG